MSEPDEGLARFEARMDTVLTQLEKRLSDGFAAMDRRFDDLRADFQARVADQTATFNGRFDDVHRRIDDLQHRLQGFDSRFTVLEAKVEAGFADKASGRALTIWMLVAIGWMTVLATGLSGLLVWLVGRLP